MTRLVEQREKDAEATRARALWQLTRDHALGDPGFPREHCFMPARFTYEEIRAVRLSPIVRRTP